MNKAKISAKEALAMVREGKSLDLFEVEVNHSLDAMDAFHLRKYGVHVPEKLITYEDEDLAYDEDFDDEEWQRLEGLVDETDPNIQVELIVEKEVKKWIKDNDIPLSDLLSRLLHNYYRTEQLIHKK